MAEWEMADQYCIWSQEAENGQEMELAIKISRFSPMEEGSTSVRKAFIS